MDLHLLGGRNLQMNADILYSVQTKTVDTGLSLSDFRERNQHKTHTLSVCRKHACSVPVVSVIKSLLDESLKKKLIRQAISSHTFYGTGINVACAPFYHSHNDGKLTPLQQLFQIVP